MGRWTGQLFLILVLLLVCPVLALFHAASPSVAGGILAVVLLISLLSFFLFRADKRRAEAGAWRIPESTLHLAELLSGWAGSFLAQRLYRHKNAKVSYQIVFWLIVTVYQWVAADSILSWRLTHATVEGVRSLFH